MRTSARDSSPFAPGPPGVTTTAMVSCPRCDAAIDVAEQRAHVGSVAGSRPMTWGQPPPSWCRDCERLYDQWVRRHATDIVWQALVGTTIITGIGIGLPLLGIGPLVAGVGACAGFGALFLMGRLTRRRRRQQFLEAALPRAYLAPPR